MQFPCHLYKVPGPHDRLGIKYRYVGCKDGDEYAELTAKGWFFSLEEAAGKASKPVDGPVDESQPTRAELEQKATTLGIKFDGRTNDKKLAEKIAEALG